MPVNLIPGNVLQATGLIARSWSKLVLDPVDVPGAIQDAVKGVGLLTGSTPVASPGFGAPAPAEILKASGLLARAWSKFILEPTDVAGGIQDVVQALAALGVSLKPSGASGQADPLVALLGAVH